MSLRIPGALPPATPMVRRDEPARRPSSPAGDVPAATAGAIGGAAVATRPLPAEPAADQWVRSGEAPTSAAASPAPSVAPEGAAADGVVATVPEAAPAAAMLAAERMRQDILARPPQASGVHGNLVTATVLNLLA